LGWAVETAATFAKPPFGGCKSAHEGGRAMHGGANLLAISWLLLFMRFGKIVRQQPLGWAVYEFQLLIWVTRCGCGPRRTPSTKVPGWWLKKYTKVYYRIAKPFQRVFSFRSLGIHSSAYMPLAGPSEQ
jgi:hypothetical protein